MTTSVDASEIARFNELAATWWDLAGPMWPLHRLNEARVPFVLDNLQRRLGLRDRGYGLLGGLTVLDVGCGAGLLSEAMARHGASVTGVDAAERNIAMARDHAAAQGLSIDYRVGDPLDMDLPGFDVVLNMEVVEHVDDFAGFMARCCELCRPGGVQFLATINRNPLSYLVAILGAEYILGWLPRGTHQWRKFVKPREALDLLEAHGFSLDVLAGVAVNPVRRSIKVSRFAGVNYMLAATRND